DGDQRCFARDGRRRGATTLRPPPAKLERSDDEIGHHVAQEVRNPEEEERNRDLAVHHGTPQNVRDTRTSHGAPTTRCAATVGGGSTTVTSASKKAALGSTGGGAAESGRVGFWGRPS